MIVAALAPDNDNDNERDEKHSREDAFRRSAEVKYKALQPWLPRAALNQLTRSRLETSART